jgi:glycosyltransferase involved in cell wall biosynthesis
VSGSTTAQHDAPAKGPSALSRAAKGLGLRPRLGVLNHHPPRPMRVPTRYTRGSLPADAPRISVVTPVRNMVSTIGGTIESVLDQGYPDLEYVVQDGGSDDGTPERAQAHGGVTRVVSEPDDGQSDAINRGFEKTTGELMCWINGDDLMLPGMLAAAARVFAKRSDVDVVYGHRVLIDDAGLEIGRWVLPGHDGEALRWADYIPQETLVWRRSIWDRVGGVDASFRFAMDWDLLLRFMDAGARFVCLNRFMGAFRIHEQQKTSSAIHDLGMREMTRLRERSFGRVPSDVEIAAALEPFMARHMIADTLYRLGLKRM